MRIGAHQVDVKGQRIERLRRPHVQIIGAAVIFVGLATALVPWSPLSSSLVPNGPAGAGTVDATLSVWLLAWLPFAVSHGVNPLFSHLFMSPSTVPISHMTSIFALSALGAPVTQAWGPVVTYNVLLRLAFATSAFAMFVVMRKKVRMVYAVAAGLLFGFGPFEVAQGATHLDLAFTAMLPVIVWLIHELVIVRRRSPRLLGAALALACAVQFYVMSELLLLVVVVVFLTVAVPAVRARCDAPTRAYLLRGGACAVAVFVVLCGYPLYELLFTGALGPAHPLALLDTYRSDLLSPFVPTSFQLIHPGHLAAHADDFMAGNLTENGGYLGVPLLATTLWFAHRFRRNPYVTWPLVLAVVAFVLSLGPKLTVGGHTLPIYLPEALLTHLPVVESVVSARFAVVVLLFVTVSLSIGAQEFVDGIRLAPLPRRRLMRGGACVVALLIALTLLPSRYTSADVAPRAAVRQALSHVRDGDVVLTYPYAVAPNIAPMAWDATEHLRFTLVGGYDGLGVPQFPRDPLPLFLIEAQYFGLPRITLSLLGSKRIASSRQYLADHHIGAIVVQEAGADPGAVVAYLDIVVGPAAYRSPQVSVWLRG